MKAVRLRLDKGGMNVNKIVREGLCFQTDLTGEVLLSARSDRAHTYIDISFAVNISITEGETSTSLASHVGAITAEFTTDAFSVDQAIQMEKIARALAREELIGPSASDLGRDLLLYLFKTNTDVHRALSARFPDWARLAQ